jgi:hypothetical protein
LKEDPYKEREERQEKKEEEEKTGWIEEGT